MMNKNKARAVIDAMVKLRGLATDKQALEVAALYPEWRENVEYKAGERVLYRGTLYKILSNHISIESWDPVSAVSLFAKVLIPDENSIPNWEQPDSTNPYKKDDKVAHANKIWISLLDGNVWEPGMYGWAEYNE